MTEVVRRKPSTQMVPAQLHAKFNAIIRYKTNTKDICATSMPILKEIRFTNKSVLLYPMSLKTNANPKPWSSPKNKITTYLRYSFI